MDEARPQTSFDTRVDVYDALIDWPRRLENEAPFFRRLFQQVDARRVRDVACGTGHHAAMFHSWGMQVEGADVSPAMIARCKELHGEAESLRWAIRSFDQPLDSATPDDAVVCIGNSLGLAPDQATIERGLKVLVSALRPGGIGVVQVLNLWAVAEGPTIWQKCRRVRLSGGERIVLKGIHCAGSRGYIDLIELDPSRDPPAPRFDAPSFTGLEAEMLSELLIAAGAAETRILGSYREEPYDRERSLDLTIVFRRSNPS